MRKNHSLTICTLLLLVIMTLTACSAQTDIAAADDVQPQPRSENDHDDDHAMDHVHAEAPEEFADLANPLAADHEVVEAGAEIFQTNCATCHGEEGKGDGPGAAELDPKPATLADGMMMNDLSDGYLFWRVSKGGAMEPFNSAMPAWETTLSEAQRWQVISFIRTLADDDEHKDDEHMDEHADDHRDDGHDDDEHMDDAHHDEDEEHMDDAHDEEHEEEHNGEEHTEEEEGDHSD